MLFDLATAIEALEDLLDHERDLILSGKIEALPHMAQDKARLLARLPADAPEARRLSNLRQKAERNQTLLAAAARGIRAASRRIDAIRSGTATLRTYGEDGAPNDLVPGKRGVNHRA